MPLNVAMEPGEATMDELIGSVTRGVYVTRFHYVNVEDPISVLLTGMTRDGTFLIEDGSLTRPLKNLRFTQGAVEALAGCEGATPRASSSAPRRVRATCPGCCCPSSRSPGRRRRRDARRVGGAPAVVPRVAA